jgi:sugar (pentulose or hexulose) kinase
VLGIDSSTQSTTAVVFRRDGFGVEAEGRYRDDPRLAAFGLSVGTPILPPTEEEEAHQPAALFLAALETAIPDIPPSLRTHMAAIGPSAQQHGQVWLGRDAVSAIAALNVPGAGVALAALRLDIRL